jgi:hypothetical protein
MGDREPTPGEEAMRVSRETWLVTALCLADLLSTLFLVHRHGADEGNTLMSYYLHLGTGAFVAAKCMLFVPALLIAEWYRRRNPRLVAATLQGVIVMYVTLYALGIFQANRPVTAAELGWDRNPPRTGPTIAVPARLGARLPGAG